MSRSPAALSAMVVLLTALPCQQKEPPPQPPSAPATPTTPATPASHDGLGIAATFPGHQQLAGKQAGAAASIAQGLAWLRAQQQPDGRWDADEFARDAKAEQSDQGQAHRDVAITGLVLYAIAREGKATVGSAEHQAIGRAVNWLAQQQAENGRIGGNATHDAIYDHAIATVALCAATAAVDTEQARAAATSALAHLEAIRNPYSVWRYQPRDNDNDSSVTGWCALALRGGEQIGVNLPPATRKMILTWFDLVTADDGSVGYTRKGEPSSRLVGEHGARFPAKHDRSLTALGMHVQQILGRKAGEDRRLDAGAELVLAAMPKPDQEAGRNNEYFVYFGSEAMRRFGGEAREKWQQQHVAVATASQRRDGAVRGSWDPVGVWAGIGGRLYSTSLQVMALQCLYETRG